MILLPMLMISFLLIGCTYTVTEEELNPGLKERREYLDYLVTQSMELSSQTKKVAILTDEYFYHLENDNVSEEYYFKTKWEIEKYLEFANSELDRLYEISPSENIDNGIKAKMLLDQEDFLHTFVLGHDLYISFWNFLELEDTAYLEEMMKIDKQYQEHLLYFEEKDVFK